MSIILLFCLCCCLSKAAWAAETAEEEPAEAPLLLPDGSTIELTEREVLRKIPASYDGVNEQILWSIPAKEPQLPLLFENRAEEQFVLFFTLLEEHYGEFHALRIEDGQETWNHPVWFHSRFTPVSPIWATPWIYFGQGYWLEKMNPDDGKIVERFPARQVILSLEARNDASIDVKIELDYGDAKDMLLHFQNGQFRQRLVAAGNLLASIDLWKRGQWVMESFRSYLELHQIRRELLSPDVVLEQRNFNLKEAERAYRTAYEADSTNPAFALYLALALYYQGRQSDAETYFQEALQKSAGFWDESLRLGGFTCEGPLPQWADAFYAQGMADYFQQIPAPPEWATLIEILIHMPGHRRASNKGDFERAMHVLQLRRQTIPYTEWDYHFSRRYIRTFRKLGQPELAEQEEQRIKIPKFWHDFSAPPPFSFLGFLIASFLLGGFLVLQNDAQHPLEWGVALFVLAAIGFVIFFQNIIVLWKIPLLLFLLSSYCGIMTFRRQRKPAVQLTFRQMMLDFGLHSYVVLLTGMHVAYLSGEILSRSPVGGKIAELLLIFLWISVWRWRRRKPERRISFKHFKIVLVLWILIWGQLAWMHHYLGMAGIEAGIPLPSIDYGHPHWKSFLNDRIAFAHFRNRDLEFMQAVNRQLAGDRDFALHAYQQMPDDPRALNNLAVMSLEPDQKQARSYFERALEINPAFMPAQYNLGVLTKDSRLIENAKIAAPWRVHAYETYAPGKLWIFVPELRTWVRGAYWSQGGFPVRGWTEIVVAVRDAFLHLYRNLYL